MRSAVSISNEARRKSIARIHVTLFNCAPDSTMDESITVMTSNNNDTHAPEKERIGMDLEEHTPSQDFGSQDNQNPPHKTPRGAALFPKIAQPQQNDLKIGFEDETDSENSETEENHSEEMPDENTNEVSPPSYVLSEPLINGNDHPYSNPQQPPPPNRDDDKPETLPNPVIVREYDYISRDIRDFLHNYPSKRTYPTTTNFEFYSNQIVFRPRGCTIDDFHEHVYGNYRTLETHHGYIQWLFPIREQGLNQFAAPLQPHEARVIRSDATLQARLVKSLKLMLDFFGMEVDTETPLLILRHSDPVLCAKQYGNLSESWHNYLRITRIFKSLVELGQPDYVPSILLFILAEQSENGELNRRELRSSMDRFWIYCMRDRDAQATVANAIKWVRGEDGVLTMDGYRRMVERRQGEGVWRFDAGGDGLERRERKNRGFRGMFNGRLRNR